MNDVTKYASAVLDATESDADHRTLAADVLDLAAENGHLRVILSDLEMAFDRAVAAHDPAHPRHASRGGQHTNGTCCEFGNLHPGAVREMGRWLSEIRRVLLSASR